MNQAELKKKVIEEMGKKGMIDHLQALYIAKVAEEIQQSDLDVLKPYRSIRTGESYNLATQIVMQYLSKKNFELALKSAVNESEGKMQDGKDAPKSLKIKEGDLWLSGLLKVWEKSKEKDAAASKEFMQREIGKRLGGLDENEAPGAEPAARAQPRAKAKQQTISAKNRMSVNPDVVVVQSDESTQGVEEESDVSINADLDSVDLGDDSVQVGTPSKRKVNESRSRLSTNEPSDFPDEDIDFDTPSPQKKGAAKKANADDFDAPTPPKKGGAKQAQKTKAMESDDDFDEPPPKKGAAKPQQQKKADDDFDAPSPLKKGAAKAAQQAAQESDFDDEDIDIGVDDDFDAPSPKKNPAPAEKPKQQKEESDFDDEDIDIGLDDDFDKPSPQKKPEPKKPELVPEKAQESSDYSDVPLLEDDDSPVKAPTRKDDSTFDSPTKPIAATQPLRPSAQPSKPAPPAEDDDDFDDIALDPTDSLDETLGSSKKSKGFVAEYSDDFDKPNRKSPSPQKAGAGVDDDPFGEEDVDIDLGFDDDDDPGPSPRSAKGAPAAAKTQPSIPKPAAQSKVVKVNSSDADDISVDLSSDDLEIDIN